MPIQTTQGRGPRFYFDTADPSVKYPGVTSILDTLNKPSLPTWYARRTAELAVDSLSFINEMTERGGREAAVQYLAGAAYRYTRERAEIGSAAHDMFERMIRGQHVGYVPRDLEPYRRHFGEFLDAVQPELVRAEDVAWSDTHRYAGSFDATLRVRLDDRGKPHPQGDPALVVADWKTGRNIYPSVALQMSAYAHADVVIDPDGDRSPMPVYDGACVLHITPDGWEFIPVRVDREVFEVFLSLRRAFDWERDISRTVIGDPIASGQASFVTGTQRRGK